MELHCQPTPVKQTARRTARKTQSAPVCLPLDTHPYCKGMMFTEIPTSFDREKLLQAMNAAPAFAQMPAELTVPRSRLRVIFLGAVADHARQCAAMLCALNSGGGVEETEDDIDFFDAFDEPEPEPPGVVSLSAHLLTQEKLSLDDQLPLLAVMDEPLSGDELADQLALIKNDAVFLFLPPRYQSRALIQRLTFEQGFVLCPLGENDVDYQARQLAACAAQVGVRLARETDLVQVVRALRDYRGPRFGEYDLVTLCRRAKAAGQGPFTTEQLLAIPWQGREPAARDALMSMAGLDAAKSQLTRALAQNALSSRRAMSGLAAETPCRSMAFSGPPGTGKSVTARLMAKIFQEEGCGTGVFVEAGREQLVGSYLGQTSPMVADLFRQARGGVLFIDEVGALLEQGDSNHDTYAREAIKALVRHMELEPETTVIFAGYPEEIDRLLSADAGLSSRVARIIPFHGYDDQTLCDILAHLAGRRSYRLPKGWRESCAAFFGQLRLRLGERFGNGREARRLLESAVEELALRAEKSPKVPLDRLSPADLAAAQTLLLAQHPAPETRVIGF